MTYGKWLESKPTPLALGIIGLLLGLIIIVPWVVSSKFEADAFNKVTGKNVSTWDAMFIELRIQEQAKE